jgi:hypothetical protein
MKFGPIYPGIGWSVVGLWSVYRVITRSTLHHMETLHEPGAGLAAKARAQPGRGHDHGDIAGWPAEKSTRSKKLSCMPDLL